MKGLIKLAMRLYRGLLAPMLKWIATGNPRGALCRFQPTCSHYCEEALCQHGFLKGLGLTVRRLLRCHPWGGQGYDPVPPAKDSRPAASSAIPPPSSSPPA